MGTYSDWEREAGREEHVREEYRDLRTVEEGQAWLRDVAQLIEARLAFLRAHEDEVKPTDGSSYDDAQAANEENDHAV